MRILHMDSGREMRGGQYQVLFLMRALRERGIEQQLFSPADSPLAQRAVGEGFALARSASGAFDIVHAHDARSHTRAVLRRLRPLVVARRVAFPVKTGLFSRLKYGRADMYLSVSKFVEARLRSAGVPASKIRVVYDAAPEMPIAMGSLVIAPATSDPRKGSKLALEAARIAKVDLHFSADLVSDLPSARLLVYLSEEEGLGSAALLAQAAGVPVLASRVGGLQEAVEHGVTGVLTANDPVAIADALRSLVWRDAAGLAEMRLAAHSRWAAHFTIDRMADETLEAYRAAC
jgi:hypothetical protein